MISSISEVKDIIVADTEYISYDDGNLQRPVCVCYKNLCSGKQEQVWLADSAPVSCPWPTTAETLIVLYTAEADFKTFNILGWPLNTTVIDLYVEHKNLVNNGFANLYPALYEVCNCYGVSHKPESYKEAMRDLILKGVWTPEEKIQILDYCTTDIETTEALWYAMRSCIDFPRALVRGRYLPAVARMECLGIPMDIGLQNVIIEHKEEMLQVLIDQANTILPVWDGTTLKKELFLKWTVKEGIRWPLTPKIGWPALDDETLSDLQYLHPGLPFLRDAIKFQRNLNKPGYPVGADGYGRYGLNPFGTDTSRNNTSSSEFIFGAAAWQRVYVRPKPGYILGYCDYEQQEFALAAVFSNDPAMKEDYLSGDPYLAFAKRAGAIPPDGTKDEYKTIRAVYKQSSLATNYGQGAFSLAPKIDRTLYEAKKVLETYFNLYNVYRDWSDSVLDAVKSGGAPLRTVYGWERKVISEYTKRGKSVNNSIKNFPLQANAAEMIRMACIRTTEAGVQVCCPIHDALLFQAPEKNYPEIKDIVENCMVRASLDITGDFPLRTETKDTAYPDRYLDSRDAAKATWSLVKATLEKNNWWKEDAT